MRFLVAPHQIELRVSSKLKTSRMYPSDILKAQRLDRTLKEVVKALGANRHRALRWSQYPLRRLQQIWNWYSYWTGFSTATFGHDQDANIVTHSLCHLYVEWVICVNIMTTAVTREWKPRPTHYVITRTG